MNILIVGSNGQLGRELVYCLDSGFAETSRINAIYLEARIDKTDASELDITDEVAIRSWFSTHGPYEIVFNCAGYTNVDACETNYDLAYAVNAAGPGYLAKACEATGAKLVHVSTDYVFSGTESTPRIETDTTGPVSAYGKTKLVGENLVLENCSRSFIVRTAWLYGYHGNNFVKTMLRLGESRDQVTVVDDQFGNPTSANDLAFEMLEIALTDNYGIYHCTNEGTCSWADFAEAIMREAGLNCEVKRCTSAEYKRMNPNTATRPLFSSLENRHLKDTIGNKMRPWQDALQSYFENRPSREG